MRVCGGCLVVEKSYCRFSGPTTYFAISMPSCGCCDCDTYDNACLVFVQVCVQVQVQIYAEVQIYLNCML